MGAFISEEIKNRTPEVVGIPVTLPNTVKEKMECIVKLSSAIEMVAKTLNSVNVEVNITNSSITNADTGIKVDFEPYKWFLPRI